ncbi:MAG: TIGR02584 family CRISPR-associated protein [Proteobacteria bacterium]|nr:TIGR02584 family CRISPR-associated protein [Pseudomonadota bacterium]
MDTRQPHEYPRRVLLFVTGLTPQVVTETLYALAVAPGERPPFVPTRIHILTTTRGAEQARLALLAPDRDQFGKLCRAYHLEGIAFDESCIEVMPDATGLPLDDLRTPAHSEAAADAITRRIASFTHDADCALHVSLAGGRKTMGFFAGYALSLYGRPQDRLSHVLVSDRFETHPQFFFIPRRPETLYDREQREMSTADARITLAHIPFVPLRAGLPERLQKGTVGYAETVRNHERNRQASDLRIDVRNQRLIWQGEQVRLAPTHMLVYAWLAVRSLRLPAEQAPVSPKQLLSQSDQHGLQRDLLRTASKLFGDNSDHVNAVNENFKDATRKNPDGSSTPVRKTPKPAWLEAIKSKTNKQLDTILGEGAAAQIGIIGVGERGHTRYRLAIAPDRIVME